MRQRLNEFRERDKKSRENPIDAPCRAVRPFGGNKTPVARKSAAAEAVIASDALSASTSGLFAGRRRRHSATTHT